AITAYLDVKGIEAKETLIEEYINLGQESGDAAIEAYIYVQPNK
ncbi:MAG: AraC family transcriptional regulator, partial [Rhizobiales bacterium]|nr:AraC family transcriptional regulator [Hyphomicrobiales bacterium]